MSPEQALGRTDVGPRSDLYSLGVLAYELISGVRPFEAASPLEALTLRLTREPPPLQSVAPGVPGDIALAVMRCLQRLRLRARADEPFWRRRIGPGIVARRHRRSASPGRPRPRHDCAEGRTAAGLVAFLVSAAPSPPWGRVGSAAALDAPGASVQGRVVGVCLGGASPALAALEARPALVAGTRDAADCGDRRHRHHVRAATASRT